MRQETQSPIHERPSRPRIALMWRGDGPAPDPAATRLHTIFAALAELGAAAEPVLYDEARAAEIRDRLLGFDGVLVWVDPISDGRDRLALDAMLRELSARGVWVSGHPDVVWKMGVKEVLFRTRDLGWGGDTHLYETADTFRAEFPARLTAGPRVLKQNRGNGGLAVWRVEITRPGEGPETTLVEVLPARDDYAQRDVRLADFMADCAPYLAGRMVDQAWQPRVGDGMVRCYMSGARVVGFGEQFPRSRALGADAATFGMASAKTMHGPEAAAFQGLRRSMETDWVPGLQARLAIETADLPALWDADFLYGPKTAAGEDSFVLCEINASSVAPFPDSAGRPVAEAAAAAMAARAKQGAVE